MKCFVSFSLLKNPNDRPDLKSLKVRLDFLCCTFGIWYVLLINISLRTSFYVLLNNVIFIVDINVFLGE